MAGSDSLRLVLLGKTGVGKSSAGNCILGEELFQAKASPTSQTKKCVAETRQVQGRDLMIVDHPGFFDTDTPEEKLKPELVHCIVECLPGPHAFIIMLKVERYTEHEQTTVQKICSSFGEEAFKHAVVLFTHGDNLDEGQTIEEFVMENEQLSELVQKCGNRYHVIDSKYWKTKGEDEYRSNAFQITAFLKTIQNMVEDNGGKCYTNEMFQAVENLIQQDMAVMRSDACSGDDDVRNKNLIQEDTALMRSDARSGDVKKISKEKVKAAIIIAGISAGALLGALLGLCGARVSSAGLIMKVVLVTVGAVGGGALGGCIAKASDAESVGQAVGEVAEAMGKMGTTAGVIVKAFKS